MKGRVQSGLTLLLRGIGRFLKDTPPPIWLCVAFVVIASLWTQSLPAESGLAKQMASEEGFFEQSSAAFLIAAALLAAASWWVERARTWLAVALVIFYMALRELDFQTMFTYRSIMSSGYYFRDVAPLGEKLIVLVLVSPCVWAIIHLIGLAWSHRKAWLSRSWLVAESCAPLRAWGLWIGLFFLASHIADRHPEWIWFLPGRIGLFEAVVEAALCLSLLFLVVELKPRLLRD